MQAGGLVLLDHEDRALAGLARLLLPCRFRCPLEISFLSIFIESHIPSISALRIALVYHETLFSKQSNAGIPEQTAQRENKGAYDQQLQPVNVQSPSQDDLS